MKLSDLLHDLNTLYQEEGDQDFVTEVDSYYDGENVCIQSVILYHDTGFIDLEY